MGIQPVDMMFTSLEEAARESVGYYQSMGMSQTEIDAAVKSNAEMLRMMRLIMPGVFFPVRSDYCLCQLSGRT